MEMKLRPAIDADYELCERLHHEGMKPYIGPLWGWNEDFQRERYRRYWRPSHIEIVVLDNEDIGYLETEAKGDVIKLVNVFVDYRFRNQGIGLKVITDLIERSRSRFKAITLNVLQNNPAKKLYERLSFKFTAQNDQTLSYELALE